MKHAFDVVLFKTEYWARKLTFLGGKNHNLSHKWYIKKDQQ